jgi:hypothetical protein
MADLDTSGSCSTDSSSEIREKIVFAVTQSNRRERLRGCWTWRDKRSTPDAQGAIFHLSQRKSIDLDALVDLRSSQRRR